MGSRGYAPGMESETTEAAVMSDTLGGDYIFEVLSTDAGVGGITDAVYNARMVPAEEPSRTTVNFYRIGTWDSRLDYFQLDWSVDCRAPTDRDSMALAVAVKDALNRRTAEVGGFLYHGAVQVGSPIPPADEADVYNTSVTLTVRRR